MTKDAANVQLIEGIREGLRRRADAGKAGAMAAYMKDVQAFMGVQKDGQSAVYREVFPQFRLASFEEWRDTVLRLWRQAQFREERYAAITLAEDRRYKASRTLDALPMYEEMIVTGAWWDVVDLIASHLVGGLVRQYPEQMTPQMLAWSRNADLWKRRTAIICQLGSKRQTDARLLSEAIVANLGDKDFFIRKGIGWALREYAKTDPDWVLAFVREHEGRLSPLSKREALKHFPQVGQAGQVG